MILDFDIVKWHPKVLGVSERYICHFFLAAPYKEDFLKILYYLLYFETNIAFLLSQE
jgi:hypothetical protein